MKHEADKITVAVDREFKRNLRIAAATQNLNPSEFVRKTLGKEIREAIAVANLSGSMQAATR